MSTDDIFWFEGGYKAAQKLTALMSDYLLYLISINGHFVAKKSPRIEFFALLDVSFFVSPLRNCRFVVNRPRAVGKKTIVEYPPHKE